MKIALVSDAVHPWSVGGKETNLFEITQHLRPFAQIDIFTMSWWGREKKFTFEGIVHYSLCRSVPLYHKNRRSLVQGILFSLSTLRLLRRLQNYDVVVTDQVPNLHLFPLWMLTRLKGLKLAVIWNEYWGEQYWKTYLGSFRGFLAARLERFSISTADLVLSISPHTSDRLRASSKTVSRTIDLPLPVSTVSHQLSSNLKSRYDVCYSGRLISHKRIDILLRAIALLKESKLELRVAIGGAGPESSSLQELAKNLGIDAMTDFLGDLGSSEKAQQLMLESKVFVSPSEREGFGLSVAEALSLGLPAIVSDHEDNASKGLVRHQVNGSIFPSGDTKKLAEAIKFWLEEDGPKLNNIADESFPSRSWERVATLVLESLQTIKRPG